MPRNLFARLAAASFVLSVIAIASDAFTNGSHGVAVFGWLMLATIVLLALEGAVRLASFISGRSAPKGIARNDVQIGLQRQYLVIGTDRRTRAQRSMAVRATSPQEAAAAADACGIEVAQIK